MMYVLAAHGGLESSCAFVGSTIILAKSLWLLSADGIQTCGARVQVFLPPLTIFSELEIFPAQKNQAKNIPTR